jgi:hypothetical protein
MSDERRPHEDDLPEEQATLEAGGERVGTTERDEPEIEGPNSE